tara:strand:+ start:12003 stop:12857 length:855 start_codon:yes stop_codon:yes gene_type:complete
MTAIRPANSSLRDKIDTDGYNSILNEINAQYTEMDKFITNLNSDILSIKDFENEMLKDRARGYDVGTSLDTLGFQKDSLQIDLDFFVHMKDVYIKKLYGDLYKYCEAIIENALAIEDIPDGSTRETVKARKFRNMVPYPPPMVANPAALDENGAPVEGEPAEIEDPFVKYDMNEIFALINTTTSNLRELADDIGTFTQRIENAQQKEARGFSVGNLIMNLQSQEQKLTLEFSTYIERLGKFLEQNKSFSVRCLNRIQMISNEIVTKEELDEATEDNDSGENDSA